MGATAVWPQQVEDVLVAHPGVLDAAVLGVPDAETGAQVQAVVQLVDPDAQPVTTDELAEFCLTRLDSAQCPVSIDLARSLPRSDTGKLYRRKLQQEYQVRSLVALT